MHVEEYYFYYCCDSKCVFKGTSQLLKMTSLVCNQQVYQNENLIIPHTNQRRQLAN